MEKDFMNEKEIEQTLSDELSDAMVEIENDKEEEKEPVRCYNCGKECSGENQHLITEDDENLLFAPFCDDCFNEIEND